MGIWRFFFRSGGGFDRDFEGFFRGGGGFDGDLEGGQSGRAGKARAGCSLHFLLSPSVSKDFSFFSSQDQTTNILQEFGQRGQSQRMRMRRSKQRMALVGGCFCLSGGERERVELRPNGAEAGAPTSSSSFSRTLSTSKLNQCHCIASTVNRIGKYKYKHLTQIQTFNTNTNIQHK